jgi:NAD(P)-dependent dehydrogenase (short-subunit alcohol dehydrogenase family)
MSELTGLKALVTGGASGIGLATAQLLAACGAEVAVLDLDSGDLPAGLHGYQADVTDGVSVQTATDAAVGGSTMQGNWSRAPRCAWRGRSVSSFHRAR